MLAVFVRLVELKYILKSEEKNSVIGDIFINVKGAKIL